MSERADGKVTASHLLPVRSHLVLVSLPFLVVQITLGAALLALRDADEGVDDYDEEDDTADAGADGDLGGVGEAGPFLFRLLRRG